MTNPTEYETPAERATTYCLDAGDTEAAQAVDRLVFQLEEAREAFEEIIALDEYSAKDIARAFLAKP